MRRAYVLIAMLTVVGLGAGLAMAGDNIMGTNRGTVVVGQPVSQEMGSAQVSDCGCDAAAVDGECGCPQCVRRRHQEYLLSIGYFNCKCRGSYKFPVPPQYTYHWPGMYSQPNMSMYNSPWRFPALEIPADEAQRLEDLSDQQSPLHQTTIRFREVGQAETSPTVRQLPH